MMPDSEKAYHKLLQRQLSKYGSDELMAKDNFLYFIQAVSDSYQEFDKDKELSDHSFMISQQDLSEINNQLKEEVEVKNVTVRKLKDALRNISAEENNLFTEQDDDLLEIVELLNNQICKRKEVDNQLLLAKEEAEFASKAKSEFLSVMSHEIRTPLNAVIGMGHLLLKNNPRKDQEPNLKALKNSADHLLVLINDILDFNKIEADELELVESVFSIRRLITDIITGNKVSAEERENTISLNIDESLPNHLIGDSLRLSQVFNNLIANAIKFTKKGEIIVTASLKESQNEYVTIDFSIKDNGVGIDLEKQASIFMPFTQASTSITRQYGGTGLGLAITKRILSLFNSNVFVTSQLGCGSEFYFTLKLKSAEVDKGALIKDDVIDFNLDNKRILLVEDTQFNILFATQLLEGWNAIVEVAENGLLANEMVGNHHYDLILMDLQMPVMDGYTATIKIREGNNQTPIIALTASSTSSTREKVLAVGMQDYVTKPFNPDDFFLKLKKYLC